MPENSHNSPSDNFSFLEPSGNAFEIATIADEDVLREELEGELNADDADAYVKKKLGVGFWIATGWILLVVLLALLAPYLPFVRSFEKINPAQLPGKTTKLGPSATYWLGTDALGRDMFARLAWGARISLSVGVASVVLGLSIGTVIGIVSGYFRRWIDTGLMSLMDVLLAFPPLLLALSIVAFRNDRSVPNIVLAIGIVAVPAVARLVRANTMTFREREFVLAARNLGAGHLRILVREILPNVMPSVIAFAVLGIAIAITAESGLAFLGASVDPPQPTWGGMIAAAKGDLETNPMQVFIPCAVLVITVLSFYFAGDRLRRYFDIKESMV